MIKEDALIQARAARHHGVERIRKDLVTLYRPLIRDVLEEAYCQFTELDERQVSALSFTHSNLYQKIEHAKPDVAVREFRVLQQMYARNGLPRVLFDEMNAAVIAELMQVMSKRMRATPALLADVHFALFEFQTILQTL